MLVMVTHDNRIRRSLNGAVRARLVHRGPEPEPADGEPAEAVVWDTATEMLSDQFFRPMEDSVQARPSRGPKKH